MKVSANDLAKAVVDTLADYSEATFDVLKNAVDKAAKKSVDELKKDSPKRTGAYSKDWAAKADKQSKKDAYAKIVYNKKHYRVTHLLEHGHRKVNGGFVAARPHIAKVEQEAIEDILNDIKEGVV